MSHHESSLPEPWIERIWSTMRAYYGAAFDRMWACPAGVDPKDHVAQLKAVWGRELRHLQQNPMALRYALEHLPERVPNLGEFKALCLAAPARRPQPHETLPSKPADPARSAALLKRMQAALSSRGGDSRAWARRLQERERRGERLTAAQKAAWRAALRHVDEHAFDGGA